MADASDAPLDEASIFRTAQLAAEEELADLYAKRQALARRITILETMAKACRAIADSARKGVSHA